MGLVALVALSSSACSRPNPSFAADDTGDDSGNGTRGEDSSTGGGSLTSGMSSSPGSADDATSIDPMDDGEGPMPMHCGNGIVEGIEKCDEGDDNARDGYCQPDCTKNECGDGERSPGQPCDDANNKPDDGCDQCRLTSCGDNVQDPDEDCDHGPEGSTSCTPLCTTPICGDGITTPDSETCDDENAIDEDACVECQVAACGDGTTWDGVEQCDDHNLEDDDGCSSLCQLEICGDGIVQTGEECDGLIAGVPECTTSDGAIALDCNVRECEWEVPEGTDCCMFAGQPCIAAVPCCGELVCNDGTCSQS
jgi:cysteine-rich repeat protein